MGSNFPILYSSILLVPLPALVVRFLLKDKMQVESFWQVMLVKIVCMSMYAEFQSVSDSIF